MSAPATLSPTPLVSPRTGLLGYMVSREVLEDANFDLRAYSAREFAGYVFARRRDAKSWQAHYEDDYGTIEGYERWRCLLLLGDRNEAEIGEWVCDAAMPWDVQDGKVPPHQSLVAPELILEQREFTRQRCWFDGKRVYYWERVR